ncbi:MAG: glucuronate isomerase [Clostridia bacterium]|nr:glucuronate isomerase [Clostridia bacterium]
MKKFLDDNFLLFTGTSEKLYHGTAEKLPIIDYHCHVPPKEIAEDKRASNISELWLGGDHYKWRCMRSCGVEEEFITGGASDYEKFRAFATIMPYLAGNPMYHWSHLELKRYFGYDGVLNADTCDEVWNLTAEKLANDSTLSVRGIIGRSNVKCLCTTDDPTDDLRYHEIIARDKAFTTKVLPAFRPDKIINCERQGYRSYITKLSESSGVKITNLTSLLDACRSRLDFFDAHGCVTADHGIDTRVLYKKAPNIKTVDDIFRRCMATERPLPSLEEQEIFKTYMHRFFASEYSRRNWVWQIHFGVLRNVNEKQFVSLGPDTGYDVIGAETGIEALAKLLSSIERDFSLPRTILYSINPSDNAAVGALIGAFQKGDGTGVPLMYQGSAWWFNDNIDGMRNQLISLANLGALGYFPGMLTDSRSFLSYTRHEYFRRILCNLIGEWAENGMLPDDTVYLSKLVSDICINNADNLFGFNIVKE